ncbi:MAG: hypothetical protein IJ621_04115 [Paludibacteraceae bacterium]|nr:hypothetical protein [Paludibacteraceae bacterium]
MNTTQIPTYQITPSDKLFRQLMGYYPAKAGASFELIATAVTNILQKGENAQHDKKIEGLTSAIHQIDGVVDGVAVEAKDHAAGQKMHAVGIGEIRNFEAAICDIKEIGAGKFWTSTRFTIDAQKYAHGLSTDYNQKLIQLFQSRPSTEEDRKGRIETIVINITLCTPKDEYQLCIKSAYVDIVNFLSPQGYFPVLYDKDGNRTRTFDEAICRKYGSFNDVEDGKIKSEDECVIISNHLIPIDGFVFKREIIKEVEKVEIKSEGEGEPVLLVICEEEKVNKLFTDKELVREINRVLTR